jgi:putative nucleotidyltransferase with HDIG domain
MEKLTPLFKKIAQFSKEENIPVYFVGGFVRDLLLGRTQKKDIDFVVEGSGLEFAKKVDELFEQKGSLVEFPDFDTARYVIVEDEEMIELEFAGARSEKYESHSRKPIVEETTLEKDLARRDFTVNAMAIKIENFTKFPPLSKGRLGGVLDTTTATTPNPSLVRRGDIIDPFNGQKDLEDKILRTPLDPDITFSEDPLRMLRAIRFATQLGFAIEPKTLEAIHRNRERIKIISAERIQEEMVKLMSCNVPSIGLTLMFHTGLMDIVLPEISALDGVEDVYGHSHKNNLVHTFKVVDNIAEHSDDVWLRMAGLFHDIGKPATKKFLPKIGWTFHAHEHVGRKMIQTIGRRLRFPLDNIKYLAKLIRWQMQPIGLMDEEITDSAVRRLIVNLGEQIDDLLILGRADITTGNPSKKERRLKNYDWLEQRAAEVIEKDKLRAFQSPVRGEEIMKECGLKPGPTVGKIKKALEEAILDGKIPNEYEATKKYFEEIKEEYMQHVQEWEKI